jgi:hypothetical protein
VAELADALDSGSSGHYARRGSNPRFGTIYVRIYDILSLLVVPRLIMVLCSCASICCNTKPETNLGGLHSAKNALTYYTATISMEKEDLFEYFP